MPQVDPSDLPSAEQRIDLMYRQALARAPRTDETRAALEFLGVQPSWPDLAHVLINTKEFIFLP